ncbi:hypothetical protein [Halovivax gelatinilyticus]|uniref:hypothetical protein n=1 Tax=Halovivax gelatinilyticus TaxID=2961597 RepID=UPI0020CA4D36|nr:hypothetical protein [Halovivax gelatinilyticus]
MGRISFERTAVDFWRFYRQYTTTAVHTAATAALAIFGLLVFVDPLFAFVAITAYVAPPVVLYVIGWSSPSQRNTKRRNGSGDERVRVDRDDSLDVSPESVPTPNPDDYPNVRDPDSDAADSDSDRNDGDTDSDAADSDSDREDGDTDSDTDT